MGVDEHLVLFPQFLSQAKLVLHFGRQQISQGFKLFKLIVESVFGRWVSAFVVAEEEIEIYFISQGLLKDHEVSDV